jgi:hypothetical protein
VDVAVWQAFDAAAAVALCWRHHLGLGRSAVTGSERGALVAMLGELGYGHDAVARAAAALQAQWDAVSASFHQPHVSALSLVLFRGLRHH